ncbi:NAD(P)-dependent oxidoreductase [Rhodonellum sp.]|uniref:NAD(P)-dependent oxidoreductase n=1 Tax=Rhodonellum sp. TaxID=2231180 RepID=UPI0027278E3E|nr:NAD(P)-dependent oxidoreductase [Rhodonellum sp.]MDO9551488.1 NAD(P)-dependent oxidoreductase [Rhodonellum sp.]
MVGTGMIARGLSKLIPKRVDMVISKILTRRQGFVEGLGVDQSYLTTNPLELFDNSDLIIVSTGDPIYSTEVIFQAFKYNIPVLTMDADTQVLTGSWLSERGLLSEGNGDQPGCLAVLKNEIVEMGFQPLVYGNIKGYQNLNPSKEDMMFWAKKQGFSLNSVTSFTDGTKLQIEQCLVANGLNANIAQRGLIGVQTENFKEGAFALAAEAKKMNTVLSDYLVSKESPPGVFIVATHHEDLAEELATYKMGKGPFYLLYKPVHLCLFEIFRDLKNLFYQKNVLLNNGRFPTVSVAAIAKKALKAGDVIEKGIGSFEVRGECVKFSENVDHVPIGLLSHARLKDNIDPGQIISFSDVDLPESLALHAWLETIKHAVTPPNRILNKSLSF